MATAKKTTRKPASTKAKSKAATSGAKRATARTSGTKKKASIKAASKPKPKAPAATEAKAPAKPAAKKPAAAKRTSALDAAAQVLKEAKKPMACKNLTETILKRGLWQTNGKTPAATLYAAIHREIDRKGKESRFEKVDRGTFALRKGA